MLRATVAREARCFAIGVAIGSLGLGFALTAAARADGPVLRVSNLGQSSAPIEAAQPPFDLAATASCAYTFTLANEGACPAGTWPPLGQAWGQIEDVAGGDTLRFEFSAPVSSVAVSSTSNYQPGLHDPNGNAILNYDVLAETPATSTADPAVWSATLPQLDARAANSQGYTFSVVAADESGYHDYPFGIRSPRYANELSRCGRAFFSTGVEVGQCPGQELPKALPQVLDIVGATYDGRLLTLKVRPRSRKAFAAHPRCLWWGEGGQLPQKDFHIQECCPERGVGPAETPGAPFGFPTAPESVGPNGDG